AVAFVRLVRAPGPFRLTVPRGNSFDCIVRRPGGPLSALFPYTTLFRSGVAVAIGILGRCKHQLAVIVFGNIDRITGCDGIAVEGEREGLRLWAGHSPAVDAVRGVGDIAEREAVRLYLARLHFVGGNRLV